MLSVLSTYRGHTFVGSTYSVRAWGKYYVPVRTWDEKYVFKWSGTRLYDTIPEHKFVGTSLYLVHTMDHNSRWMVSMKVWKGMEPFQTSISTQNTNTRYRPGITWIQMIAEYASSAAPILCFDIGYYIERFCALMSGTILNFDIEHQRYQSTNKGQIIILKNIDASPSKNLNLISKVGSANF